MKQDEGDNVRVQIIVPTYKERDNLEPLVTQVDSYLKGQNYGILFVDDNSQDGSEELILSLSEHYPVESLIRKSERGLSSAVIDGIKKTNSDYVVLLDADGQHPFSLLPEIISNLHKYDLVLPSRYVEGGGTEGWSLKRKLVSRVAALLAKPLLPKFHDPASGFIGFRRYILPPLYSLSRDGFKIGTDILAKSNYESSIEIPYIFRTRTRGESKFSGSQVVSYIKQLLQLYTLKLSRLIRFGIAELAGTIIVFALTFLFTELAGFHYLVSLAVATVASFFTKYWLNKEWTFAEKLEPSSADYEWKSFYKGNLPQRVWKRKIANIIWKMFPPEGNNNLLDIGCGSSPIISKYPGATGIDVNLSKLNLMRSKCKNTTFLAMWAENLWQFGDNTLDKVLFIETIEHLENPKKAISEIVRVLKDNGEVIIATPETGGVRGKLWSLAELSTPYREEHIQKFTRKSLETLCLENNLKPIEHKYVFWCDLVEKFRKSEQPEHHSTKLLSFGVKIAKRVIFPEVSRANFALTYSCNQKCKTCNIWHIYSKNSELKEAELRLDEVEKIIERNNLIWVSYTGGEPFLREDTGEILMLSLNRLGMVSIVTNGYNPEFIESSVRKALNRSKDSILTLNVSLEGKEEVHNSMARTPSSFVNAIETLNRLNSIKNERLKLGIEYMASRFNRGEFLNVKQISKVLKVGLTITYEQQASFYRNLEQNSEPLEKLRVAPSANLIGLASYLFSKKSSSKKCVACQYSCFIDPYGNVNPCIFFADVKLSNLRESNYHIIISNECKKVIKSCKGCLTPCETYATMVFRPWRLL